MFVIKMKQHGALNCEEVLYGPFPDYMAAEDALGDGSVPLLYGQGGRDWPEPSADGEPEADGHRCIVELTPPGMAEPATNHQTLWDRFRAEHGPRPGGRGFAEVWERKWFEYKREHGA